MRPVVRLLYVAVACAFLQSGAAWAQGPAASGLVQGPDPALAPIPAPAQPAPLPPPVAGVADGAADSAALSCLVQPYQVSELGSASPAVIQDILVQRGDMVHKGQVVVELDRSVDEATLALRQTEAAYLSRVVGRNNDLYKKNLLPAKDYDEMVSKLQQAREQVRLQKTIIATRSIRSPFDGVVAELYAGPGDRVNDNKLLKLAQLDPLLVKVVLPEARYGSIHAGETAHIHVSDAVAPGDLEAAVWRIDKVMDAASGTFTVLLKLDNPGQKIPAGIRCSVKF